ncbi:MAG: hypothetical protein ABIV51_04550 [Saprospiraceae bacterium]
MKSILSVLFLLSMGVQIHGQTIHNVLYKLVGFNAKDTSFVKGSSDSLLIETFWQQIAYMDLKEQEMKRIQGKPSFGVSFNQSIKQDILQIDGGINLQRGGYPSTFRFESDLSLILLNKKINENLSNIYLSYDFHPRLKDSLLLENYIFVKRFTDAYLNVEQRYEVGTGTIIAFWSRKLSGNGQKAIAKLDKMVFDNTSYDSEGHLFKLCTSYCQRFQTDKITDSDVEDLVNLQGNIRNSIRKSFSTLRTGVLVGVFVETEKITIPSEIRQTDQGPKLYSYDFNPEYKLRFEVRPFVTIKPNDALTLKFKPYFKFPMPWLWDEETNFGDIHEKKKRIIASMASSHYLLI